MFCFHYARRMNDVRDEDLCECMRTKTDDVCVFFLNRA